ncbi:MAG: hypothetical protein V1701_09855, partial [Planctomycetota bacterium]
MPKRFCLILVFITGLLLPVLLPRPCVAFTGPLRPEVVYSDANAPFTKEEWAIIKANYLELYKSSLHDKKKEGIRLISDLNSRFLASDDAYAFEAVEFLFWLLNVEQAEPLVVDIKACIGKFSKPSYVEWIS